MLVQTERVYDSLFKRSRIILPRGRLCERRVVVLASPSLVYLLCVCLSQLRNIKYQIAYCTTATVLLLALDLVLTCTYIRLEAMPSIILIIHTNTCTREDGLAQCGRSRWVILMDC